MEGILLAVATTILGSIFGVYFQRVIERQSLPFIDYSRRKALNGEWSGVFQQQQNTRREALSLQVRITLKSSSRSVKGTMIVSDTSEFEFGLEGAFIHARFLRLNYSSIGKSSEAIDFGTLLLMLADYPNKMSGSLCGYGSISEQIVNGSIILNKDNHIN